MIEEYQQVKPRRIARIVEPPTPDQIRRRALRKMLENGIGLILATWQLVTLEEPPKSKEVLSDAWLADS